MTDERISEYELEGELIPTHWCWFFVTGFIALLTSYWVSAIIAVVVFGLCIAIDIHDNQNLSFNREALQ